VDAADTPETQIVAWHALVGRACVSFAALERVLLQWVAALANDAAMAQRLFQQDMKAIAPALRRQIQRFRQKMPKDRYDAALAAVEAAEELIEYRNDIAHSWQPVTETESSPPQVRLCVAKAVRDASS